MNSLYLTFFRIIILLLLIIYSWVNVDTLHWKTYYQSIIFQVSFYIVWEFYNYRKNKSFKILNSTALILNVGYWTILSSLINSITVDFYKLGRYSWNLDFFKYTIGIVPIIIAYSINKYKDITRCSIYLVLLLSSISFYYTFLESPEIALLIALPLLLEINYKNISYFNPFIVVSLVALFFLQVTIGHISFYGYGILCNLFLIFTVIGQRHRVNFNFYLFLIATGAFHVITRQYLNNGSLDFFSKDSSSILNSNRVSGYFVLFIPIALKLIKLRKLDLTSTKGLLLSFLIILVLTMQYSRGALTALVFVLFIYIILHIFNNTFNRILIKYIFNPLLVFISLSPIIIYALDRYNYLHVSDFDAFSAGRFELWKYFINIYLNEFPLINKLFGIGIAQNDFFINYFMNDSGDTLKLFVTHGDGSYIHPHNIELGVLVYTGFFGFVLFNFLIWKTLFNNISSTNNKRLFISKYLDISIIYIFMIHGSVDFLLDINSILIIIFFLSSRIRKNKNLYFDYYNNDFNLIQKTIYILLPVTVALLSLKIYDLYELNLFKFHNNEIWKENNSCHFSKLPNLKYFSTLNEEKREDFEKLGNSLSGNYFYGFRKITQSQEGILILLSLYKTGPSDRLLHLINRSSKLCSHFHYKSFICELNSNSDYKVKEELFISNYSKKCKL